MFHFLSRISLDLNAFHGIIPSEVGVLQSLEVLNAASNELEGSIPKEIGNLVVLEELNFGTLFFSI